MTCMCQVHRVTCMCQVHSCDMHVSGASCDIHAWHISSHFIQDFSLGGNLSVKTELLFC